MEKTLYVISSFAPQVKRDMGLLGWTLLQETPILYQRRMKLISDRYRPDYRDESIYALRFSMDDEVYQTREKETAEYLQLMEEPFTRPSRYRFCIPILIASTFLFFWMAIILLWIFSLPEGPFHNGMWAYIVFVLTLGLAQDVVVPTIVILVSLGLTASVGLAGAIVFAILLAKKKKQSQQIAIQNEELAKKKTSY